jgi:hypothetical protein
LNYEEYKKMGEEVFSGVYGEESNVTLERIEKDYWDLCANSESIIPYKSRKCYS